MFDGIKFGLAWSFKPNTLPEKNGGYSGARRTNPDTDLEEKFRLLQEESSRTLALISRFRSSPLHRVFSYDP